MSSILFQTSDQLLLGSLQKGSLDLTGAVVELSALTIPVPVGGPQNIGQGQRVEWLLRVQTPEQCSAFEAGVGSRDQALGKGKRNVHIYKNIYICLYILFL